jgi:hypothetical protein
MGPNADEFLAGLLSLGLDRRPCTSPCKPRGEEGAVPHMRGSSRRASSGCCWNAAHAPPTKTGEENRCARRRRVSGFKPCLTESPANQRRK